MPIQTYKPSFKVLDADYYEAQVTSGKEVPNQFYKPDDKESGHPTQIEVEFTIDSGSPTEVDTHLKKWFSPTLGEKSFLTAFLRAMYPDFDRTNPTPEQLEPANWLRKDVRIQVTKEMKNGMERNRIGDITPPKKK